MAQPVTIENEALRIEVWPMFGGKVSSIVDKADNYDLLFNYPAELPTQSLYDVAYVKGWYAGWDECFPAVAASRYVGHPYDGIAVPDHGELWGLPTTAVPSKAGITTVWHGLRFGYRLTRKISLEGPSLLAEYTLINLAPFDFHFVWSMHAVMAMEVPVELRVPAGLPMEFSHDADANDVQQAFEWPTLDGQDMSHPAMLPVRRGWKLFGAKPIGEPAEVRHPTRGRSLKISYASDDALQAYWGIWINTGGWAGHRHFAIEPTTGRKDQLDRAIRDRSAGTLDPLGRLEWSIRWTMGKIEPKP